jgi:transposase
MSWASSNQDASFRPLFATRGRPAEAPWRLALVSVIQFAEQLSDRQAAEAVRARIDWKYLLGLELADSGFDASVLSEFRARLVAGGLEQRLLDALLTLCRARGWLRAGGRQRTDSTQVLAASRAVQRAGCARQTLRLALNTLAEVAPVWLIQHAHPEWVERYDRHNDDAWQPSKKVDWELSAAENLERMGLRYWRRSTPPMPRPGCRRFLPSNCCGASGSRTTCPPTRAFAGALEPMDSRRQPATSAHRTIWMPTLPVGAAHGRLSTSERAHARAVTAGRPLQRARIRTRAGRLVTAESQRHHPVRDTAHPYRRHTRTVQRSGPNQWRCPTGGAPRAR